RCRTFEVLVSVGEVTDQLLGDVASAGSCARFQSSSIFLNRKFEFAGCGLSLLTKQLRCGVYRRRIWSIPVKDRPIQSAADHIVDLLLHLACVVRAVAHVYVVAAAKPSLQMRVELGTGTGIQQLASRQFAHIACDGVSIRLRGESAAGAGVVAGLGGECCGWGDRERLRRKRRQSRWKKQGSRVQ